MARERVAVVEAATYTIKCPYCGEHAEPTMLEHLPPFGPWIICETCERRSRIPRKYQ